MGRGRELEHGIEYAETQVDVDSEPLFSGPKAGSLHQNLRQLEAELGALRADMAGLVTRVDELEAATVAQSKVLTEMQTVLLEVRSRQNIGIFMLIVSALIVVAGALLLHLYV